MATERKLAEWVAAGLIDADAADRIRQYERRNGRRVHPPRLSWAVAALGLFAVALGIALIVSANWDRIPAWLKLGTHFAAILLAGGVAWHARDRIWVGEAALFLFAALVLAGIVLQAQIYQLSGPGWGIPVLWLALSAPALAAGGKTQLTGATLALGTIIVASDFGFETVGQAGWWVMPQGLAMAAPVALVALAMWGGIAAPVRRILLQTGLAAILAGVSLAHFHWASPVSLTDARDMALRLLPVAALTGWTLYAAYRCRIVPRDLVLPLLAGPFAALLLVTAIPHAGDTLSRAIGVAVYAAMWGAIARGAARAGTNLLFAIAVGAIALRIFIVYIELFGSLSETGWTLLAGGLLLVALAAGWRAIVARVVSEKRP